MNAIEWLPKCSECKGVGCHRTAHEYESDEGRYLVEEDIECPLCNGSGYLDPEQLEAAS